IERRERAGVPDVPADWLVLGDIVRLGIHVAVDVAQAVGPEAFPGEHLGMLQQDAPERDEGTVDWRLPAVGFHSADPLLDRLKPLASAVGVDAFFLRGIEAMRTEAAHR